MSAKRPNGSVEVLRAWSGKVGNDDLAFDLTAAADELERLNADARRMDWLADPANEIGQGPAAEALH